MSYELFLKPGLIYCDMAHSAVLALVEFCTHLVQTKVIVHLMRKNTRQKYCVVSRIYFISFRPEHHRSADQPHQKACLKSSPRKRRLLADGRTKADSIENPEPSQHALDNEEWLRAENTQKAESTTLLAPPGGTKEQQALRRELSADLKKLLLQGKSYKSFAHSVNLVFV